MTTEPNRRPLIYRRIAEDLRDLILSGEHPVEEPLPTEFEIVEQYGVSRQTVRRAFADLVAEGLVYRIAGKGTFIRPVDSHYRQIFDGVEDLIRLRLHTQMSIVTPINPIELPPDMDLDWPEGQMYGLRLLRLRNDIPFCRTQICLAPDVGWALRDHPDLLMPGNAVPQTVIGLIETKGFTIKRATQETTACAAEREDAALLGIEVGSPLLAIERTFFDENDRPLQNSNHVYVPDRYSHTLELSRWGTGSTEVFSEKATSVEK